MPKSRERQRENKKLYCREEALNAKTAWGISDPTPKAAVANIIAETGPDRSALAPAIMRPDGCWG